MAKIRHNSKRTKKNRNYSAMQRRLQSMNSAKSLKRARLMQHFQSSFGRWMKSVSLALLLSISFLLSSAYVNPKNSLLAQSVTALDSFNEFLQEKKFQSEALMPFIEDADQENNLQSWEQIVFDTGLSSLEAAWETEVDAEIEKIVLESSQDQSLEMVISIRNQLDMIKDNFLLSWQQDANKFIQESLEDFNKDLSANKTDQTEDSIENIEQKSLNNVTTENFNVQEISLSDNLKTAYEQGLELWENIQKDFSAKYDSWLENFNDLKEDGIEEWDREIRSLQVKKKTYIEQISAMIATWNTNKETVIHSEQNAIAQIFDEIDDKKKAIEDLNSSIDGKKKLDLDAYNKLIDDLNSLDKSNPSNLFIDIAQKFKNFWNQQESDSLANKVYYSNKIYRTDSVIHESYYSKISYKEKVKTGEKCSTGLNAWGVCLGKWEDVYEYKTFYKDDTDDIVYKFLANGENLSYSLSPGLVDLGVTSRIAYKDGQYYSYTPGSGDSIAEGSYRLINYYEYKDTVAEKNANSWNSLVQQYNSYVNIWTKQEQNLKDWKSQKDTFLEEYDSAMLNLQTLIRNAEKDYNEQINYLIQEKKNWEKSLNKKKEIGEKKWEEKQEELNLAEEEWKKTADEDMAENSEKLTEISEIYAAITGDLPEDIDEENNAEKIAKLAQQKLTDLWSQAEKFAEELDGVELPDISILTQFSEQSGQTLSQAAVSSILSAIDSMMKEYDKFLVQKRQDIYDQLTLEFSETVSYTEVGYNFAQGENFLITGTRQAYNGKYIFHGSGLEDKVKKEKYSPAYSDQILSVQISRFDNAIELLEGIDLKDDLSQLIEQFSRKVNEINQSRQEINSIAESNKMAYSLEIALQSMSNSTDEELAKQEYEANVVLAMVNAANKLYKDSSGFMMSMSNLFSKNDFDIDEINKAGDQALEAARQISQARQDSKEQYGLMANVLQMSTRSSTDSYEDKKADNGYDDFFDLDNWGTTLPGWHCFSGPERRCDFGADGVTLLDDISKWHDEQGAALNLGHKGNLKNFAEALKSVWDDGNFENLALAEWDEAWGNIGADLGWLAMANLSSLAPPVSILVNADKYMRYMSSKGDGMALLGVLTGIPAGMVLTALDSVVVDIGNALFSFNIAGNLMAAGWRGLEWSWDKMEQGWDWFTDLF